MIDISCPSAPPARPPSGPRSSSMPPGCSGCAAMPGPISTTSCWPPGLTRGAFYAHFTSKDDLFAEIVRMGHGLLPQAARRREARCRTGRISRPRGADRQRPGLRPRLPRRRCGTVAAGGAAGLRQRAPWRDRRAGARARSAQLDADATAVRHPGGRRGHARRALRATRGSATGCCAAPGARPRR